MTTVTKEHIEAALKHYQDPYLGCDLVSAKAVKDIRIDGDCVKVAVELGYPIKGWSESLKGALKEVLGNVEGVREASVEVTQKIIPHSVQKGVSPLPEVKNIIAVASGKGGVGKSTVAVNLALAFQSARRAGRDPRCRYLRSEPAPDAGLPGETRDHRR